MSERNYTDGLVDGAIGAVTNTLNGVPFVGSQLADAASDGIRKKLPTVSLDQDKPDSEKNPLEKFLSWINGLISSLMNAIRKWLAPNNLAADNGMSSRIDGTNLFNTVDAELGIDGAGLQTGKMTKKALDGFIGPIAMPNIGENGDQSKALANIIELHGELFKYYVGELGKKYPYNSGVDSTQIEKMAAAAATAVTGVPLEVSLEVAQGGFDASRLPMSAITTGYGGMLLKTQRDMAGKAKGSVDESIAAELTPGISQGALHAALATIVKPVTPEQTAAMQAIVLKWIHESNNQKIGLIGDANGDGKVDTNEAIAALAGKGITADHLDKIATFDEFKQLMTPAKPAPTPAAGKQ